MKALSDGLASPPPPSAHTANGNGNGGVVVEAVDESEKRAEWKDAAIKVFKRYKMMLDEVKGAEEQMAEE
jgi:hypothetical protein